MGAKPSKSIIDDNGISRVNRSQSTKKNDRSSHQPYYQRKTSHLKQALTPKHRSEKMATSANHNASSPSPSLPPPPSPSPPLPSASVATAATATALNDTPITCTTEHKLPNKTTARQPEPNYMLKRSSPSNECYDSIKSKKMRRSNSPSTMAGFSSNSKHQSVASSSSNTDYYSYSKSNISSGWTTLSNDPFSQIEASTSAFTEITDQSTISRKSLYPVLETATSAPPSYYDDPSSSMTHVPGISTLDMLDTLNRHPQQSHHLIVKEAYQRAQQQNDEDGWHQFYNAIHRYMSLPSSYKSIGVVYLARCLMLGLGVPANVERGLNLLKSHQSCETAYALGRCYLDGYLAADREIQGVDKKAAFECLKNASEYEPANESMTAAIGEAQCSLARMLFQGEGVEQNTQAALSYLMKSADNNNIYAQFLIGVHYERGFDIAQDLMKAKDYYGKSADGGFPDAQAALGSRLIAEAKYAHGIEWLEKAVQMGNSRAHVQLGILYDKGEGIQQNSDMALLHYKAAVENGNHAAEYILGLVYYFGRLGRQKNHKEAVRLIRQSAMAGLPYAQRVLGQLYQLGSIVSDGGNSPENRLRTKKNEREAVRWFKRAAAGKDVCAMGILGKCHEQGIGVEIDLEKALGFYAKAAEGDSPYVCNAHIDQALLLQKMARHADAFRLYRLVLDRGVPERDGLAIDTARLSIARYHLCRDVAHVQYDPLLAHSMLQSLVETSNSPHAHYWLGSIYDEGIPGLFEIDRQKAFQHFLIAANAGDNDATFLVAYMMSNHVIPLKGPADAFPWYQKAAAKGHPMSMHSLGLCYYKGIAQPDCKPQLDAALEWFDKAARLGVAEATAYMARIHLQSMVANASQPQLAQQHFAKAVQCLKKAADKNDAYAQRELGKIYLTGKGLTTDYRMAVDLLGKAAAKNDAEAITFLGDCYHKGTGVVKNMEIAVEHYLRAATLGYPYAYSACAELYYGSGNMELAYDYYVLASQETKIAHNRIGKTARMMVARLALGLVPLAQTNPDLLRSLAASNKTVTAEAAFDMLSRLAIQDQFPQAFQPLGCCYLHGTGTVTNPLQAIFWFRKSAEELDDSIAYFNLADMYGSGRLPGVPVDLRLALSYLKKSADMGYIEAQYRMGMIYLSGEYGVRVDERSAANWFKLSASKSHAESIWMLSRMAALIDQSELELQYQKTAASLGHVLSMRVLGQRYLEQLDVPFLNALMQQEYLEEALKYLHMAGDAGDTESLVLLGKTYNNCTKTKIKFSASSSTNQHHHNLPTPSNTHSSFCDDDVDDDHNKHDDNDDDDEGESRFQCEEDEKNLAIECFEKASALGDIDATVYAAEAWYEQKQYAAALEFFEKAASQGNVLARFFCARYCIEGYGGSQLDPEKGFQELLICANDLNCVHAYNTLAQCYENGIGTAKDDQLAYEWYARAAEATRDAEAFYRIAQMYAQRRIPPEDPTADKDMEACKFYNLAVNATPDNHGRSCYQLGLYYLKGIPNPSDASSFLLSPDICLSIEYLRTAADLRVQEAMLQLGILFLNDDYSLEEQEEGLSLLQRAAQLGLCEAQFELGLLYHRGKEVIVQPDDQEEQLQKNAEQEEEEEDEEECIIIPQDFEKAYDLFCRSAVQKHPTATFYLGIYHQHGIFVAPDLAIALEQFEISVELFDKYQGAPDRWQAEFTLARILHHDVESRARAYQLFQAAHLHAPKEFQFLSEIMIARYHLYGWANVDVQAEHAAATLIRFAQEERYGYRVYLQVGLCFEHGLGVDKNLRQAFHWYGEVVSKAHLIDQQQPQEILPMMLLDEEIEEDEASAMFNLAEFYRQGIVVAKDINKADNLYRLAARKGSQAAQDHLSFMLQKTNLYD
ncbi:hypothetical protein [Parasitella parasitica]|uniref:Uncharacterized protein n=1 Tax=Parasitella parasitica TaxID=35722 RepID=A0A0B7N1I2_9FUNG|nr:hypothetical protein [Parasitella parasitica]